RSQLSSPSLHDALPISADLALDRQPEPLVHQGQNPVEQATVLGGGEELVDEVGRSPVAGPRGGGPGTAQRPARASHRTAADFVRSEEHTSELQSHLNLV